MIAAKDTLLETSLFIISLPLFVISFLSLYFSTFCEMLTFPLIEILTLILYQDLNSSGSLIEIDFLPTLMEDDPLELM